MSNPMDRSGRAPGSFGLTGTAGLQLKAPAKKFGLQKPKQAAARPATSSVFGAAAMEDTLDVKEELERMRESKHARAAAEAAHQEALQQDSSIFDYDGAYDAMQDQRKEARAEAMGKQQKKAKYIGAIMEAHKEREIENDKIFERKLVKEAEAEAHLYGDKEKFVTAAYRKKMEAREQYEAEQRAKEAREAKEDVTKRSDMSHFYSNLLHGRVGGEEESAASASRDAAYAASFGGKAAGAVPPPSSSDGGGGGGAASSSAPAAQADEAEAPQERRRGEAGAAAAAGSSEAAGGDGESGGASEGAVGAEASGEGAAAPAGGGKSTDEDLLQAIAAANAKRAERPAAEAAPEAVAGVVYERRNDGDAVLSAKERYLQRKKQKMGA